jgi:caspase 7
MSSNYKMNHEKRGFALVINIRSYDPNPNKLEERIWSVKDVENLKNTFEYLEFDLKLCQNLKKKHIEEEIQKQASLDHSQSDCFVCVVMSHGNEDKIVASDNEEICFEEIMRPIKLCATLSNKPKLFFFQACRGENVIEISPVKSRPDSGVSICNEELARDDHTQNNKKTSNKTTRISAESDLLVYNATLPKHYAYGTELDGTIFIKNVCKVLNEAYKELPNNIPLSKMILNINKSVRDSGIQLADPINHLMADIYFSPKNVS